MEQQATRHPASYRDPSGFIFTQNGVVYRQVNKRYAHVFDEFINSECYAHLVQQKLLIPHQPVAQHFFTMEESHATLMPEKISCITYPYEWSFDMLRNAALLTLRLVKESMAFGFILKDATPYNIQWHHGRFIFIDTLSFEPYKEAEPWVAYRQFCEQFLAPLLIAHYKKIPPHPLLQAWPDGIPLGVAAALLPFRSRLSLHTYLHIHLNARISKKKQAGPGPAVNFSRPKLQNIINSLQSLISSLKAPGTKTTWSAYYEEAASRDTYLLQKDKLIDVWVAQLNEVHTAADLGANDGRYAQALARRGITTVAADFDAACINNLYNRIQQTQETKVQPLILDLANPSPAGGVNNEERTAFMERCRPNLVLALALIHHLSLAKNIPLEMIADFFGRISNRYVIIEFVPKEDEKVQYMLSSRKDIFDRYTIEEFKAAFESFFTIQNEQPIGTSGRTLFLLKRK